MTSAVLRVLGAAWSVWVLTACSSESPGPTQTVVTIDAAESVRATIAGLHLQVQGETEATPRLDETKDVVEWPVRRTIMPQNGDLAQVFRFWVDALGPDGVALLTSRLVTGFVENQRRYAEIFFDDACVAQRVVCEDWQTCRDGACSEAWIDPVRLPTQPDGEVAGAGSSEVGGAGSSGSSGVSGSGVSAGVGGLGATAGVSGAAGKAPVAGSSGSAGSTPTAGSSAAGTGGAQAAGTSGEAGTGGASEPTQGGNGGAGAGGNQATAGEGGSAAPAGSGGHAGSADAGEGGAESEAGVGGEEAEGGTSGGGAGTAGDGESEGGAAGGEAGASAGLPAEPHCPEGVKDNDCQCDGPEDCGPDERCVLRNNDEQTCQNKSVPLAASNVRCHTDANCAEDADLAQKRKCTGEEIAGVVFGSCDASN